MLQVRAVAAGMVKAYEDCGTRAVRKSGHSTYVRYTMTRAKLIANECLLNMRLSAFNINTN